MGSVASKSPPLFGDNFVKGDLGCSGLPGTEGLPEMHNFHCENWGGAGHLT